MTETTKKIEHTPGPWKDDEELRGDDIGIRGSDGTVIALVVGVSVEKGGDDPSIDDARNANARLIAAAPELHDVLRKTHAALQDARVKYLGSVCPEAWDVAEDEARALLARIDGCTCAEYPDSRDQHCPLHGVLPHA